MAIIYAVSLIYLIRWCGQWFGEKGILNQILPKGCHVIALGSCTNGGSASIVLSSTSPWYQLPTNQSRLFTQGIVFVEIGVVALPVSITGAQVVNTPSNFEIILGSLELDPSNGTLYGEERPLDCLSFALTPRDIRDFLTANSFIATYFYQIANLLPDWLRFRPTGTTVLGVNDLSTALQTGAQVEAGECQGAPLYPDRLYSVFKFGAEFSLSVYGKEVTLPAPVGNKTFCVIVDICQDFGGSLFLILPEESRDLLDSFPMFKSLMDEHGIYIRPIGIGLSIARHINVHSETTALQLWNGDELFQYP